MSEKTADIIDGAADYLESHGWWRKALRGPNGRQVCAVGAIVYSQGWEKQDQSALMLGAEGIAVQNALMRVIQKENPTRSEGDPWSLGHLLSLSIERWNDHVARDKQHVLDVMRKAAKWERLGYDPDA